jgi:hypothetical protein
MSARLVYRIAAMLLVLFAVGHTLGFSQADPKWGLDSLLASLRATSFDADGFRRTWWDFYLAVGWISGLFYLFAAVLAWQLGDLPVSALARLRGVTWGFALSFAAITAISCTRLFLIPIAFSAAVTLALTLAAWLAARTPSADPAG